MHPRRRLLWTAHLAFAFACSGACGGRGGPSAPDAPYAMLRQAPERTQLAYADPWHAAKRELVDRMNRDRAAVGAPPLQYEPRAARVGDLFSREMALAHSTGHFDPSGRAPFTRWGLAGGVDYHGQNAVAFSGAATRGRSIRELLFEAHDAIMAEHPPDDGHRQLVLNPLFTHAGIGVALEGEEFRMTQELTRVAFEWIEIPDRPLPVGARARFAGQPLPGWRIAEVEIRRQAPLDAVADRKVSTDSGSYVYPPVVQRLYPSPPPWMAYRGPFDWDFSVGPSGRFRLEFPLDSGPGEYYVVCLLRPWPPERGSRSLPATAALIRALSSD